MCCVMTGDDPKPRSNAKQNAETPLILGFVEAGKGIPDLYLSFHPSTKTLAVRKNKVYGC